MERVLEYAVEPQFDGETVMTVLRRHFQMSTSLIKELRLAPDGLKLNGSHIRTIDTVKSGDVVTVTMRDKASENIVPVNIPIDIVYEDEDVLIVNKPPAMPTHISVGNYENSLANAVMYHYMSRGEEHLFRAVNRLDKDTSGLMAVAKNSYAHARLADEISEGELRRKYICVVCGDVAEDGTVNAPIARKEGSEIERCVSAAGHEAVTHYKVIDRLGDYTVLEMSLETGRTHQIRVHMAHIDHPLAGDWLYGVENKTLVPRQMLHSSFIRFTHPVNGNVIEFTSKIPTDMEEFIKKVSQKALKKT